MFGPLSQQQQQMQQQKRPSPSCSLTTGSQKRRKLDSPAPVPSGSRQPEVHTILVGPPGRRTTLTMPMPSSNTQSGSVERSASRSLPLSAIGSQGQSMKRNIEEIELGSDGEEVQQKKVSPPRKKVSTSSSTIMDRHNTHATIALIAKTKTNADESSTTATAAKPGIYISL